jgi:spore coat polysaccharide biosynthesis protein SpsF
MPKEYLRNVELSDMEMLYEWANDPVTRSASFNMDHIPFDVHKKWFEEKINSKDLLFFIYHNNKQNIGQVRLDIKDGIAIINYSINPNFRGKGYGYKMLLSVENKIKNEYPIIKQFCAEVKEKNKISQNIFLKLQYTEIHENDVMKYFKNITTSSYT